MPRQKFRFNPFLRIFTLLVGILAIAYGVYAIFVIQPEGKLRLVLPYIVILLAANSVFRNLFTLNSITFAGGMVIFKKLALPKFSLKLKNIVKISFVDRKMRYLRLSYQNGQTLENYTFNLGFPAVLDALSEMKKKNPAIEFAGDLGKDFVK